MLKIARSKSEFLRISYLLVRNLVDFAYGGGDEVPGRFSRERPPTDALQCKSHHYDKM